MRTKTKQNMWLMLSLIVLTGVVYADTEVYPTGDPAEDTQNVQDAVDVGGTVLLKGTTELGDPQYFNFGGGYVEMNNDVVIVGEPGSITLPDGRMVDRSVVYGGGGTQGGEGAVPDLRGAFTVMSGNLQISGLWLDSSSFAGIFVRGCNGATISDNVITYTRGVNSTVPGQEWRSWAKPICLSEWPSDQILGDIIIEGNLITFNPDPPDTIRWAEGISVIKIESSPMPNISIIGNTIVNPGTVRGIDDPWKYRDPKGIQCWHPATIRDNTIRGSWENAIYSESVVSWSTRAGSVVEGNLIESDTYRLALQVAYSNNSVVSNNTVRGKSWRGIAAAWSTGTVVRNNTVSGDYELGIDAWDAPGTEITDNTIELQNPTTWSAALRLGRSDDSTITGNTILGTAAYALLIDSGSSSNKILRNDLRGFSVGQYINFAYDWACDSGTCGPLGTCGTNFTDPLMTAQPGIYGNTLRFDSADKDRVIDPDGASYINGQSAFTVAMWIKSDEIYSDKGFLNGEEPDGGDNVFTMRYDRRGGYFGGTNVIKAGINVSGVEMQLESSSDVQTTEWQHLALVWESGQPLKLYIDGVLDTPTGTKPSTPPTGTTTGANKLLLGAGAKDAAGAWDGLIDEVHIFDRAVSETEISTLMNNPGAIGAEVAYYDCDSLISQGNLQVLKDQSNNGHDGLVNPHFCDPSHPLYNPKYLPGAFVYLDITCNDNVVFEAGEFPPGEGGASHCVIDLGTNNRTVGLPAKGIDDPGIGAVVRCIRCMQATEAAALAEEDEAFLEEEP